MIIRAVPMLLDPASTSVTVGFAPMEWVSVIGLAWAYGKLAPIVTGVLACTKPSSIAMASDIGFITEPSSHERTAWFSVSI